MKENFDDIIKRKWEHMQFPVDENHRADMIQLLDQQKRRRGVFFWWLGGLLIVIVAGSMFLLSPNQGNDQEANTFNSAQTDLNATTTTKTAPQQLSTVGESKANQQIDNTSEIQANPVTTDEAGLSTVQIKSESNKSNTTTDVEQAKARANSVKEKEQEPSAKSTKQHTIQQASPVRETKPDITVLVPEESIDPVTPKQVNKYSISESNESITNDIIAQIISPASNIQVRDISLLIPIQSLPVSLIDVEHNTLSPVVKPGFTKEHPFSLFAEAGVGYVPPSFPNIKSGWSMELGGGVSYSLLESTNLFLSGGYYLQKGGFDFKRTSTADQPGFGTRSISNSLTPDKLHFIYSKIGVEHKFRRHSITGALGLQWLYGAQGTIDIRAQDQFNQQAEDESKYAWLVLDGMNDLLWSGELEYGYLLSPRFKVSLGLKHYFSRIRKDDAALKDEGYYWSGKLAPFNPSFTIQYRIYGK